jgi:hypothetical protein
VYKETVPAWLLPEVRLASRPALIALILLLLVGMGMVLGGWSNRPESADFDLHTASSSHKLDIISAKGPANPPAPAFSSEAGLMAQGPVTPSPDDVPAILEIPAPDPADSPGPYKVPDLPVEAPHLLPPEQPSTPAPIVWDSGNLFIDSSLRGDTPMMRTWKMLGYPAILTAALTAAHQIAAAQDSTKNGQGSDAKSDVTLKDVNESLKAIQKKLEENRLNANILGEDVRILKEKVAQLQRDVDALRSTRSNYQPVAPIAPAAPSTGRIRLVNTWPERITVFLNDKSYTVEPNRELGLDVPAGPFTYEILGVQPDNSILPITQKLPRTLAANETFMIHVHPR